MATNSTMIKAARRLAELNDHAMNFRKFAAMITHEGLRQDATQQASQIDNMMVTLCNELRRLAREPYGDKA